MTQILIEYSAFFFFFFTEINIKIQIKSDFDALKNGNSFI